jgi:outer membrane receptor for ferric coprogen and ferric-rhodotorulic acid
MNILQILSKNYGDWVASSLIIIKTTNDNQMLYFSGNPSATDNTSGIYLYPEIYNQVYRDKNANLDIQGTFPLLGQRHELDLGYSWANQTVKSQYAYGSSMGIFTTDLASWSPATNLASSMMQQPQIQN